MPRRILILIAIAICAARFVAHGQGLTGNPSHDAAKAVSDSIIARFADLPTDSQYVDSILNRCIALLGADPKVAERLASAAEERAKQIGDSKRLAKSYLMKGSVFRQFGAMDLAIKYFDDCLDLSESIGELGMTASAYNNLATIKSAEGDRLGSIQYFRKARIMLIAAGKAQFAPIPLQNIAASYSEMGELELSIAIYDTVVRELRETQDLQSLSTAKNNLGTIYLKLGDYKKSRASFQESKQLKTQLKDNAGMGDLLLNLADYYLAVHHIDSARDAAVEAGRLFVLVGSKAMTAKTYQKLAQIERAAGNWQVSTDHYERYISIKDSVETVQEQEARARLLTAFDIERKEAEIGLLSKDKQLQDLALDRANVLKWVFGGGIATLLIVVLVLWRNNRQRAAVNGALQALNDQISIQNHKIELQNDDLKGQNDRLEVLNREMDGILHVVAHDLKAPLNQAAGLIAVAEERGNLDPMQEKTLAMAKKVTFNACNLVNDLLVLGHAEQDAHLQLVPVPLKALVAEASEAFAAEAAQKSIHIETALPPEEIVIHSESSHLRRILDNLISNAIKFSPAGKLVVIQLKSEGKQVMISIQDQGPGISPADQQNLYRKFHKLSARPTGGESSSGLGLAIVKTLVEQLGGEIALTSEVGVGSIFVVSLSNL